MQQKNKNIARNTSLEMFCQNISTKSKGFTLVELIIVITILAILGTIAYISFQGYTKDARDSSRMSDIKQIYNGLSIYKTQTEKTLLPDNYVNILSGTTAISYQGYAGANVLRSLRITGGKDPGTKDYYIYSTDVNTKKAQLMTYMETSDKDVQLLGKLKEIKLIDQAQAVTNTGYYQDKKIYVYGDKIGILTNNKVPLQETTTSTGIDITTLTGNITTYFGGSVYSGGLSTSTGLTLINQINGAVNNTLPCSSTTYNSYAITSLQDKQSQTFTKTLTITGGTQIGSIIATCNNGTLSYGTENLQTSCTSSYTLNGNSCVELYLDVTNSLRFDSSRNTYLQKTFNTNATNNKKGTINLWFKPTNVNGTVDQTLLSAGAPNNESALHVYIAWESSQNGKLNIIDRGGWWALQTSISINDPSKFYNLNIWWDTIQGTDTLRFGGSIDGNNVTWGVFNPPAQDTYMDWGKNGISNTIGNFGFNNTRYFDGYMSQVRFIDGDKLGPENFGVNVGGKWLPKSYTGTYGTNGFYLNFINSGNLGDDIAGTNDWTLVNYSTPANDQMIDSPTNNFVTLDTAITNTYISGLSNGNLKNTYPGTTDQRNFQVFLPTSGKWYAEFNVSGVHGGNPTLGIMPVSYVTSGAIPTAGYQQDNNAVGYLSDGRKNIYGIVNGYGTPFGSLNTVGAIIDINNKTINFYVDNLPQGEVSFSSLTGPFMLGNQIHGSTSAIWNFGQGGQSGLNWCANAGGYFRYCPPAGFKALSSKNIGN